MGKTLKDLLTVLDSYDIKGKDNIGIDGVTDDSREVDNNYLFICLSGYNSSGYDFVKDAVKKGAKALLVDRDVETGKDVSVIKVPDVKIAMHKLVPFFYNYPAQKMKLFGITGTNGKTTVSYMLRSIAQAAEKRTGVIGTIDTVIGNSVFTSKNTTPDVPLLQKILSTMQKDGEEYVFMEVSSHALALDRIAGCEFDVAVLTNITQDHLDFHKTFEAYVEAKSLLFKNLSSNKKKINPVAVINADDKNAQAVLDVTYVPVMTYGMQEGSDIYPFKMDIRAKGMDISLHTPQGDVDLSLLTTGHFNVYNVMAAVGAALADGMALDVIKKGLDGFKGVSGRFELVESGQPFTVIVDYAHTPDGLENLIESARKITGRKLITVFGCGGNRDKGKRPVMGQIATALSDKVFVTSDNPRKEVPESIIEDIMQGIDKKEICECITDRKTAIHEALSLAQAGDVVVIAGKGHETYQILGDKTIDFDDRRVAREFLEGKYIK